MLWFLAIVAVMLLILGFIVRMHAIEQREYEEAVRENALRDELDRKLQADRLRAKDMVDWDTKRYSSSSGSSRSKAWSDYDADYSVGSDSGSSNGGGD